MWGVLGAMAGVCSLWVLLMVGVDFVMNYIRAFLSYCGFSWSDLAIAGLLHLQFAMFGFVVGSGFRFLGLRKQSKDRSF